LTADLREKLPGLAIRTTFMAGFSGETETEFEGMLDFVARQKFEKLGAFAFSPEPGTKAFNLKRQVAPAVRQKRRDELMHLQKKISYRCNILRMGETYKVMVEGSVLKNSADPFNKCFSYYGRSYAEAPEVDGKIYIKPKEPLIPGEFSNVKINRAWDYDLGGIIIR
ncbi:MAG: 30S ribosomal protein S12 methylthiotransferase RimO, partial [bacterium]|nr:30S ribosomal protein S12 methylthiotransferase RimO [bacterium]